MSQILHIFRKDVRHLWIEILLSLVAVALRTYSDWLMVTPGNQQKSFMYTAPLLLVLFIWWFMIARLVHSEALVGDRQFWITRPYVWHKLLVAKMLFIIVFFSIPTAISEIVLLRLAHAAMLPHVSVILSTFIFLIIIGILLVFALATVTRNLSQWIVGAIVLIFVLIGLAVINNYIPNSQVLTGTDNYGWIQAAVFSLLTAAGVVTQYAWRRKAIASAAFAAAIISIPAIMLATPYRSMIAKAFPAVSSQQVPFRFALQPPPKRTANAPNVDTDGKVQFVFPFEISGLPDGTFLRINGFMLSVDSPDGHHWESEWLPGYGDVLYTIDRIALNAYLDRSAFDTLKNAPADARLFVAFTELRESQPIRLSVNNEFELPKIGLCWLQRDGYMSCRSTDIAPKTTLATLSPTDSTCTPEASDDQGNKNVQTDHNLMKYLAHGNATDPLSPLTLRTFFIHWWANMRSMDARFCPGTPVTFSTPQEIRKAQVQIDLGQLRLDEYAQPSFDGGFGSFSVVGIR